MVTQTAAGQQPAAKHTNKISAWKEATGALLAAVPSYPSQHQEGEPSSVRAPVTQSPNPVQSNTSLPSSQESTLPGLPQLQEEPSAGQQVALGEIESSQPETVNVLANNSPRSQLSDVQFGAEEPSTQTEQLKSSNIDDLLKRVIEEEREKAERARGAAKADSQSDDVLRVI